MVISGGDANHFYRSPQLIILLNPGIYLIKDRNISGTARAISAEHLDDKESSPDVFKREILSIGYPQIYPFFFGQGIFKKKRLGKIAPLPIGLVSAEDNPEEMKINKKRKVTQMKDIFL